MTALQIVQKFYPEVTSIKDATKPLLIEVTTKDANSRAVRNHKECALAVACKRQGNDAAIIAVCRAYLIKGNHAVRYHMPEHIAREIVAFDRNGHFSPGDYYLKPPEKKIGSYKKGKTGPHKKNPSRIYSRTDAIRSMEDIG